jgi:predicted enzyme related to lactoylglutathione lyase
MPAHFRHVMLLVNDLPKTVAFYRDAFGLEVRMQSPVWTELVLDGTTLAVHATEDEVTVGNAVHLSFEVDDMDTVLARLLEHGAKLEGEVRKTSFGQVASLRSPDGHCISLTQRDES